MAPLKRVKRRTLRADDANEPSPQNPWAQLDLPRPSAARLVEDGDVGLGDGVGIEFAVAAERSLAVCAYGGFLAAQQAARWMLRQGSGAILFTGASASVKGYARSAPSAMGKFSQRGLAQSIARELSPRNIRVAHFVIVPERPVRDGVCPGQSRRGHVPGIVAWRVCAHRRNQEWADCRRIGLGTKRKSHLRSFRRATCANHKWFRNLAIPQIIAETMQDLGIKSPQPTVDLAAIRREYHQAARVEKSQGTMRGKNKQKNNAKSGSG